MTATGDRLAAINARIHAACVRSGRDPKSVVLVAVAKKQPLERIEAAIEAGHRIFGENYVQELETHRAQLGSPELQWHLIGHLQTNKAKKVAQVSAMIHSVDSQKLASALALAAEGRGSPLPVLIEVNLAGEGSKSGCTPSEAKVLAASIAQLPTLSLRGLMTMPPPELPARPWFVQLRQLRDALAIQIGAPLPELSMGMSHDFEEAIEEGATLVRVGTAVFGERG